MGIKPENSGGEATGSRECPRKLITANSLVRGSVTDMTERDTFDRQAEERFAAEQQVLQLLASDDLAAMVQLGLRYHHLEHLVESRPYSLLHK